jgi:hypothetical protein
MYRQSIYRKYTLLLASTVILTLPTSVLLHAVIPHNHGGVLESVATEENFSESLSVSTVHQDFPYSAELGEVISAENSREHNHPGDQSGDTGKGTANIWNFIHFSLRNEHKKIFFDLNNTPLLVHAILMHAGMRVVAFVSVERVHSTQYENSLSSGVLAFRAFG